MWVISLQSHLRVVKHLQCAIVSNRLHPTISVAVKKLKIKIHTLRYSDSLWRLCELVKRAASSLCLKMCKKKKVQTWFLSPCFRQEHGHNINPHHLCWPSGSSVTLLLSSESNRHSPERCLKAPSRLSRCKFKLWVGSSSASSQQTQTAFHPSDKVTYTTSDEQIPPSSFSSSLSPNHIPLRHLPSFFSLTGWRLTC